jgi:hypothetical protein
MKRLSYVTLASCAALALSLAAPRAADAQEVNFGALDDDRPNMLHANTGLEYAFVVGVGYSRIFRVFDRHLVLTGDFRLPYAKLDFSDYRLRVGLMAPLVGPKEWKLAARLVPLVRGVENDLARLTNLGVDVGLVGGYYARRWFVAAELGFDWAITTHIEHSKQFRETAYADAVDGWYAPAGGNFYYGLLAGCSFPHVDIVLRGGQPRDMKFRTNTIPFYATLGINVRFGDAERDGAPEQ